MLLVLFAVTLVFSGALVALMRDATQLRRTITLLEHRVLTLELDARKTPVIEPGNEAETPPRPPNALVN